MRTKRSYLSVAMIVALLLTLFSPVSSAAVSPKITKLMQSYVSAMQPGWNLGNTFDSFDTTVRQKMMRRLGATLA